MAERGEGPCGRCCGAEKGWDGGIVTGLEAISRDSVLVSSGRGMLGKGMRDC